MNGKLTWSIFWALVGIFVVIGSVFFTAAFFPTFRELLQGFRFLLFIIISGAIFTLLGAALIFLTVKEKVGGILKKFLLLTGASAAGFLLFILLHNAVYGLFIYFFGAEFWAGGDEPFFFVMAIFVCPIGFLVGTVGSIVIAIKRLRAEKKSFSL